MNPSAPYRQAVAVVLFSLILVVIPFTGWAKNECVVEYKTGNQTLTKSLNSGQTFTFSPVVSSLSWVRNTKVRPLEVQVTNLGESGSNPKWVTLPAMYARDPLAGSYSGSVKLYKARCPSLAFPDVQKTPTPGGPVPIPYPKVGQ